jgi:hypothetical protein
MLAHVAGDRSVREAIGVVVTAGTPGLLRQIWPKGSGRRRRASEPVGEHAPQFLHGLTEDPQQVRLTWLADPAGEGDLEDGDPRLGGQARGRLWDTAVA